MALQGVGESALRLLASRLLCVDGRGGRTTQAQLEHICGRHNTVRLLKEAHQKMGIIRRAIEGGASQDHGKGHTAVSFLFLEITNKSFFNCLLPLMLCRK